MTSLFLDRLSSTARRDTIEFRGMKIKRKKIFLEMKVEDLGRRDE